MTDARGCGGGPEQTGEPAHFAARDRALEVTLVLVACLLPLIPLVLAGGWPAAHDGARYAVLVDQFRAALLAGEGYPRWLAELYGRFGYPTFCFYPPGLFYLALPFSLLPWGIGATLVATLATSVAIGVLGAYALVYELAGRRLAAAGALLFALTPYLYVNVTVRGDLAELLAMCLVPWAVFCLLRIERAQRAGRSSGRAIAGLALACGAVVGTHPAVGLFLPAVLGGLALAIAIERRSPAPLAAAGLGVALGISLAAPYWWTVLELRPEVALEAASHGYYRADRHVVAAWQLVDPRFGFGDSTFGTDDGMSFHAGAGHLLLAGLGALAGGRAVLTRSAALGLVLVLLAMTALARPLWREVELLRLVQFPWRLLSVSATLQLVAAAGLGRWMLRPSHQTCHKPSLEGWKLSTLALLGIAVFGAAQWTPPRTLDPDAQLESWRERVRYTQRLSFANEDEFTPRSVRRPELLRPRRRGAPDLVLEGPGSIEAARLGPGGRLAARLRVAAPTPMSAAAAVHVRIEQIYLPGWEVRVDGESVPRATLEATLDAAGRMRVALPPGTHTLDARYAGPPGWERPAALAGIAALSVLALGLGLGGSRS